MSNGRDYYFDQPMEPRQQNYRPPSRNSRNPMYNEYDAPSYDRQFERVDRYAVQESRRALDDYKQYPKYTGSSREEQVTKVYYSRPKEEPFQSHLPRPWVKQISSKGTMYFYNSETGESRWNLPKYLNEYTDTASADYPRMEEPYRPWQDRQERHRYGPQQRFHSTDFSKKHRGRYDKTAAKKFKQKWTNRESYSKTYGEPVELDVEPGEIVGNSSKKHAVEHLQAALPYVNPEHVTDETFAQIQRVAADSGEDLNFKDLVGRQLTASDVTLQDSTSSVDERKLRTALIESMGQKHQESEEA